MNRAGDKAPRTGKVARTAIAGLASTRVGIASLRQRLRADDSDAAAQAHEAEIGRILMAAMTQLRGTALKAAQVLSLDADFLPAGVRAELARASHQALPLNRALVGRVFRQAFGCEPQALFRSFEPTAFAAASLGQVHRAVLHDGTTVAVKIQYPGIEATIETDLRLLRHALHTLGRRMLTLPDPGVVDRLLDEIARQLLEEVDYEREADAQRWFGQHLPHPDVVVAEVVASHSRRTVLTQTLLPGVHVQDWMAGAPSAEIRHRQGQALFDGVLRSALQHGRMHGDLHPGNVLFMPDGRVGLLDFGCTAPVSASFARHLSRTWLAWLHEPDPAAALLRNYQALDMAASDLEGARFEAEVLPAIAPMLDWATEPFTAARFDFTRKSLPPKPQPERQAALARHMTHVPTELMSWDRAWLGLMHLLRRLEAHVDTRHGHALLTQAAGLSAPTT